MSTVSCAFFFVDEVTRDFIPNIQDPEMRKARLIPWVPADLTSVDYFQKEPDVSFFQVGYIDLTEREREREGGEREKKVRKREKKGRTESEETERERESYYIFVTN